MKTFEVAIDNAKMQIHCHDAPPPVPLSLGSVFADVDVSANPATVTGSVSQWTDLDDATYATVASNGGTPSELNGFAYTELLGYVAGQDISVTVRLAIKPDGSQPGPGHSSSVQPTFNVVSSDNLSRGGALGFLAGEAIQGNYPTIQALVGPQTWSFTFPGVSVPSSSPLYVTMTMPNTTYHYFEIYQIDVA